MSVILLTSLATVYLFFNQTSQLGTINYTNHLEFPHRPIMHMAIINGVHYHGEIWYSYMYAAAVRCHWNVSLFTGNSDENSLWGITHSWTRHLRSLPQKHVNQFIESTSTVCSHQIIVICTLEGSRLEDIIDILLNKCDKRIPSLLIVTLHQGKRDIPRFEHIFSGFPSLLLQKRVEVRYLTLADHVKEFAIRNIKIQLGIDIWRVVFPIDLPVHAENDQHQKYIDFIVQGNLEDHRRNYSGFAAEIKRQHDILRQHNVVFTIVGNGDIEGNHKYLKLPGVHLHVTPRYMPANVFFKLIYQAVGIIPLFSQDKYYTDVQSSSVVCSLLTQTPLLASQRLVDSHKYIPKEAVWLKLDNETDVAATLRISNSFPSVTALMKVLFKKRQRIKQLLENLYVDNDHTLNDYINTLQRRTI